ncbi:heat-shock protein Hsp20 [Streptomyces albospinus]|uniref:Heat-shock protein Hsp20 n=1 Tax=Streptomyces albospinus TaxID=285515 RepID=A0ABQ2V8K7_9ACTN|nr:Hsp20/alpha crystallin family protein [Streptomyces albospinus]GGU73295.1 heat-shock protein Hsp20 [Streptomyces albospinus]
MNMPVRRRPGSLLERALPSLQWGEPIASEFDDLYERMSHLLETAGGIPALSERTHWAPLADMHETDDAYVIEAELPGVERDGIDVEITNRELRISGEYKACGRQGVLRRSTRRTGRFEHRSTLPVDVRTDDVTANLNDGVLTVTIPKAQAATPRHIDITT